MSISTSYRATMFDGQPELDWLRLGWRALRLYGQKAKAAMQAEDLGEKAEMISRADHLLTVMTGIIDLADGSALGSALMRIYAALRVALLEANISNRAEVLDDYDKALKSLDMEFATLSQAEGKKS